MKKESLRLYSCITPALKRWKLFISLLWMLPGLALIFYGGIYVPAEELASYGWLLWTSAFILIAIGFIPYQKLICLENNPHVLVVVKEETLYFLVKEKQKMKIPLKEINAINFIPRSFRYGMTITLKNEKTLFFPFFTERACKTLTAYTQVS